MSEMNNFVQINNSMFHLKIMDRLRNIAMVHQAMQMAEQSYSRIKSSNVIVQATLTQAESVANQLAVPVWNKLEQPIHLVDNLVCQSIDKIELSVSILSKNSIVGMVQKRLDETMEFVQTSTKQVRSSLDQSLQKTSNHIKTIRQKTLGHINSIMNISETFIRSVDRALNAAENALDRLIPALKPEAEHLDLPRESDQQIHPIRLFQRMIRFSHKLRVRIVQYTFGKWSINIQQSAWNFREIILKIVSSQLSNRLQMFQPSIEKTKQS